MHAPAGKGPAAGHAVATVHGHGPNWGLLRSATGGRIRGCDVCLRLSPKNVPRYLCPQGPCGNPVACREEDAPGRARVHPRHFCDDADKGFGAHFTASQRFGHQHLEQPGRSDGVHERLWQPSVVLDLIGTGADLWTQCTGCRKQRYTLGERALSGELQLGYHRCFPLCNECCTACTCSVRDDCPGCNDQESIGQWVRGRP
jgi:hypothetical protein